MVNPEAIYKSVITLAKPVLRWHLNRRIPDGKEIASRLPERYGFPGKPRPAGKLIWLHGASNGESMSLLPIIEQLRALPNPPSILVTTGTVSSAVLMEKLLPEQCIHQFIPLDHPQWVKRFLDYWRPAGVVWIESELWPSLLSYVRAQKIPAALLNARLSEKSGERWLWFPQLAKSIADTFTVVTAQTEADAIRWRKLGGKSKPQLLGNLKFIAQPLPYDAEALNNLKQEVGDRPLWLFASAHPGEDIVAREAHSLLQNEIPNLLTVIVPRHIQRGNEFTDSLRAYGCNVAQRSKQEPITDRTNFYMADTLGELGLFYRLSKLSVVGASFVPIGGHNPIEPALLGSFPLYGPQMFKQQAICAVFEAAQAAQPVVDAIDLASHLRRLLSDHAMLRKLGEAAQAICIKQAESRTRIWHALAEWRIKATID